MNYYKCEKMGGASGGTGKHCKSTVVVCCMEACAYIIEYNY